MIAKVSRESLKSFEVVRLLLPPRKHLIPGSKGVEGGREQDEQGGGESSFRTRAKRASL